MQQAASALSDDDLLALQWAVDHLEHPSLAARLSSIVGTPVEMAAKMLPRRLYRRLHEAAEGAIGKALGLSIASLERGARQIGSRDAYHRGLVATTGAIGGGFGLLALMVELPITTTIMLRSIAEVARSQGEDLSRTEARLACMEVFALGGHAETDDAAETGYYGIRLALALSVSSTLAHVTEHGLTTAGAPLMVGMIRGISSRFGITLSEKAAAQAVPLIGAAGGAAINVIFLRHYQDMARGHFLVRRLERIYGAELIRAEYERLARVERRVDPTQSPPSPPALLTLDSAASATRP